MQKLLAVGLLLLVGSCGEPTQEHPAGATPYTQEEMAAISRGAERIEREGAAKRADRVMACGLALLEAERRGLVSPGAQMPPPWELSADESGHVERVSCQASDRRGALTVVVDLRCTDVNDDRCHPLVRIDRP